MNSTNGKYIIGIILILLIDSLHNIYFNDDRQLDVFLFFDYENGGGRYIDNILLDVSSMFKFSILSYFLIRLNKRIFKPLFILSLGVWVSYFTFYNQISSLFLIPLYGLVVIYYNRNYLKKWIKT